MNLNAYRYGGAGGQEKDDEVAGVGNSYTAQFWQFDPRLGRRWNPQITLVYGMKMHEYSSNHNQVGIDNIYLL